MDESMTPSARRGELREYLLTVIIRVERIRRELQSSRAHCASGYMARVEQLAFQIERIARTGSNLPAKEIESAAEYVDFLIDVFDAMVQKLRRS